MKPRRVVLTIEVETNEPLRALRSADSLTLYKEGSIVGYIDFIEQIQANVIRPRAKAKK